MHILRPFPQPRLATQSPMAAPDFRGPLPSLQATLTRTPASAQIRPLHSERFANPCRIHGRDLGQRGVHVAYVLIESPRRFDTLCISRRAHSRSTSRSARSKKLGDQHEPAPPGYDRTAAQHRLACPDAFKALSASRSRGEAITSIPALDASGDPTENIRPYRAIGWDSRRRRRS